MTAYEILSELVRRMSGSRTSEAVFHDDEISEWPSGLLDLLVRLELLRAAQPAVFVECDGCEERCTMPVHVYPEQGTRAARAFVSCDKREDVGRIHVKAARLRRWHSTSEMVARAIARLLNGTARPLDATRA